MLERLTPEVIAALARKHGITAERRGTAPEGADGGSDDHGDRRAATIYTEVDGGDLDPSAFLRRCVEGRARTVGNVEKQEHLGAAATCGAIPPRHQGPPPRA